MPMNSGPAWASARAPDIPVEAMASSICKRVLLVDDNVDGADSLAVILTASGHEVRVVYDPLTALQVFESFAPDVAVLDIGLPVMDGYELAARLRAIPATNGVQLIALTGYGRDHDARKSERAGFGEHLVKPVAPDRLLAAIERLGRV
jgi:CheY-like chemotaxis protein